MLNLNDFTLTYYKNVVSFSVEKIILPNRPCIQSYNSNVAPRLNDYPYLAVNVNGINFSSYGTNKTLNNTMGIFTHKSCYTINHSQLLKCTKSTTR